MTDSTENTVLLSTFYCGKKKYRLYFHRNQIVWDNETPPYSQNTLPIENVISVHLNNIQTNDPSEPTICDPNLFTIHYAERKNNLWRYNSISFKHSDALQVSSWVKTLQNHLQRFSSRPKRLLLFINPYGGKGKALEVFEKYGKPLFAVAGVDVSVIVSQRQNQIRDMIINHNLDVFDSVACVGGDGTVSEIINGLVIRECQLHGIDPNDTKQLLPKPSFPVGIIPGGSTDTIVYCLHGTTDVSTAVLHIIFGEHLGLDLVSVHNENRLLRLFASALSYGYLGDIAYKSEQLRWMGPMRYDYCGFKRIIANEGYKGEIAILSENEMENKTKCYEKCSTCLIKQNKVEEESTDKDSWKIIQGKFFMINGANISCACERSPSGLAPYCHLGDGYLHLIVMHHTSFLNNIRMLHRFTKDNYKIDDLSFIEVHKVKEFCFRALDVQSRWNCDGEIQQQSDIRAKVHCQLLNVFSRGSIDPEEITKVSCIVCK